jgi:signal transduction histidine kinase/CheY-like chemotaxis protein/HAMP domain-containing protein
MAGNLTAQVRNIAWVTTAVANGDLSRKITVEVRGEILELKNTVNTMVDQLRSFASEVTRVAREVGVEGKLGGQARVKGVGGVWKDLTDNVNSMAANLTGQVRNIADVTTAVAKGDLSKKITVDVKGEILELKNTINTMVDQLNSFASEVTRVAREVGTEGKLGGQADVRGVAGVWKDLTNSVNSMASNLTNQVRNIAEVTTAVANGDLSRKITVRVRGEMLQLKKTINTMVDQLNSFAAEVTRVAREVGTEGKLGGQAQVKGVGGVWKDLTDNVNSMALNLTNQVRRIAKVVTAVATGNLKQKLPLEARGEIAALADTINDMIDTLATFADQVTDVAREVGAEGKLGGQARVPGATGIWRDLTDNVNQLAANLTNQVRAIADVSTAVTKGDLSQTITVQAHGEVAALKDNINKMIHNLRETTRQNAEQDWLKTNLARFARLLQGQRSLDAAAKLALSELAPLVSAQIGAFYAVVDERDEENPQGLKLVAAYGRNVDSFPERLAPGEGMVGQAAEDNRRVVIEDARILPPLGSVLPVTAANIVIIPIPFEGEVRGVLELAASARFSSIHLTFMDQLAETMGIVMNTITATTRTETLLDQSLKMSRELQSRQDQLQETNAELEDKARLLSEQKKEVETKNREIEVARSAIEEKAEQLALTSKYKSQFLANMSHELRTPLNSLLILARTLSENHEHNLQPKQVEFAQTIYASGKELLLLINDILDLSKIESGTISLELTHTSLKEIQDYVERNFHPIADEKRLEFSAELSPEMPATIYTDAHRLKQVLRNMLSNALKFTAMGRVSLRIGEAKGGWTPLSPALAAAKTVIAFSVTDTGIGIPSEKQKIIFEAFQQVDMTTSRKYGGTGLGLSISRKLAELLGGEIQVTSVPRQGSTFTLYLPFGYAPAPATPEVPEKGRDEAAGSVPGVAQAELPESGASAEIEDDREGIAETDRVLLAITGQPGAAAVVRDAAREAGFKAVVAGMGEAGLNLGRRRMPSAIFLDPRLPDLDGWVVLDRLKHDPKTRHIPVCLLARDGDAARAFRQGAFGVLKRPLKREALGVLFKRLKKFLDKNQRRVLLVEKDGAPRRKLRAALESAGVRVEAVDEAQQAMTSVGQQSFDCVVLDPGLPGMKGASLIEKIHDDPRNRDVPIVVDARGKLTAGEEAAMKTDPRVLVVRGDDESGSGVVDKLALVLHQDEAAMPEFERRLVEEAHARDPGIAGKKILIVDDDVRNIFALASLLERYHVSVLHAENGKQGLERLQEAPDVDAVLMDVMMPDMDGYEAMRAIRSIPAFNALPIIALTAKAMKGDREKCLQAGASDYIPKPVDVDMLLSLLRVWLNR